MNNSCSDNNRAFSLSQQTGSIQILPKKKLTILKTSKIVQFWGRDN